MWTASSTSTEPNQCNKKNTVAHRTVWTGLNRLKKSDLITLLTNDSNFILMIVVWIDFVQKSKKNIPYNKENLPNDPGAKQPGMFLKGTETTKALKALNELK